MDEAERWLKRNDPEFHYKKRRHAEYPFHTARQEFLREQRYIPVSNLWAIRDELELKDYEAQEIIERLK